MVRTLRSGLRYVSFPLLRILSFSDWVNKTRKPGWWFVLADDKSNRIVVPPLKITDVPFRRTGDESDFRSYKIQFQAPQNVGLLTWRVYIVSDSFVGEEATKDVVVRTSVLTWFSDLSGVDEDR